MITRKLLYSAAHPKLMFDASMYRLQSLLGHRAYRKFIILTQGRTGSNMLISMLNAHGAVYTKNEIFQRLYGRAEEQVLAKIYASHPMHIHAVGFKIFYQHPFDAPASSVWDQLTQLDDLHVIHLKRRNLLRLIVSRKIALQTDSWVNRNGRNALIPLDQKQVRLTAAELRDEFVEIVERQAVFNQRFAQLPMLTTHYEDLTTDADGELARITDFLGLTPCAAQATVKRQNPEQLSNLLVNYAALKAEFTGSDWAMFFTD